MNHLIHETSPYLLQHAHNPVEWHPWGEAALEKARQSDKPILVSIGYAACHWCHVMERESFEDPATAALMNAHFINIKIDREERPDLDHIYMDAVQAMTGSGGWPLNVFLTPDTKPFYGGTYFPPARAHNRASWQEVLLGVHNAYTEKKAEMQAQADQLTAHLQKANAFGQAKETGDELFTKETLQEIAAQILSQADTTWGGFGQAPKFPQTFSIQYLLRHHHFTKHPASLQQALLSLDKMIAGGIYDQLGGGFARYSTDATWLAPHFEKMLYDNALLVGVLAEAYQLTHEARYAKAIRETLTFIEREMSDEAGGFYSALDADSEGIEGKFYTWQLAEIEDVLGADAALWCAYYDVSSHGNWEETNIPRVLEPIEKIAASAGIAVEKLEEILAKANQKLMERRAGRIRPLLDDKILLGWNALMNTAYSKAYAALGEEHLRQTAIRNMDFLERCVYKETTGWCHTYKNGIARIPAFLDDFAYLIEAYIHLQEITGEGQYLFKAKALLEWVDQHFSEPNTGFYFYTHEAQTDVILRKKEVYDGAVPSGNAVMARNLGYLAKVFDHQAWQDRRMQLLRSLGPAIVKHPTSFGVWAACFQTEIMGTLEISVVGQHANQHLTPVLEKYLPNKILQSGETNLDAFPLLRGKQSINGEVRFYLCRDFSCRDCTTKEIDVFLANV